MKRAVLVLFMCSVISLLTGNKIIPVNNQTKEKANLKLTVVYDNYSFSENLQIDWGFGCFIEFGENKILFDTGGKGDILLSNMEKLGIDPKSIDIIILSHFHNDHTGGLSDFLDINSKVKVYYPQSLPNGIVDVIKNSGAVPLPVSEFIEILPDVYSLGEIKYLIPEQALAVRSEKGIIVVTGCAHPGIINILELAKKQFPGEKIHLVLGGFHLRNVTEESLNDIIQKMLDMEIQNVSPTHCTGDKAREMFKNIFDTRYIEAGVGKVFNIN